MRIGSKVSSSEAASLAGHILSGGSFTVRDVVKLAASVLTQRPPKRRRKVVSKKKKR